jgi:hypothetical protein
MVGDYTEPQGPRGIASLSARAAPRFDIQRSVKGMFGQARTLFIIVHGVVVREIWLQSDA